jgi:glutathione synthase/RimK-type ligase-like ATP-grasp enzyme
MLQRELAMNVASTVAPVLSLRLEAAKRVGCTARSLDPETGYLWEIARSGVICTLYGGLSPLNDTVAAALATDKFHAGNLLARAGFRVPTGIRCLRPGRFEPDSFANHTGTRSARDLADTHGFPLIVKPGHGARGRNVSAVADVASLDAAIQHVWQDDYLALVQESVAGIDLRVDLLDDVCLIAYLRRPLRLVGDGVRKLRVLLQDAGAEVYAAQADPAWHELASAEIGLESVPSDGQTITFRGPVLNLNCLASAEVVDLPAPWLAHAQSVAEALGLRHCGIDFKIASLDTRPETATVIEANASPSMLQIALRGHRETVLAGEEKIIEAMLEHAKGGRCHQ